MSQELLNHKTKCRLCFQRVSVIRNCSRISEKIQQKFLSLTNIELKLSDSFSNSICKSCIKSLNEWSEFQQKMVDNQQRLYAFEGADKFVVKIEPIELGTIELQEIDIGDFLPKTEVFDDSFVENQTLELPMPEEVSRPGSPDDFPEAADNGFTSSEEENWSDMAEVHSHLQVSRASIRSKLSSKQRDGVRPKAYSSKQVYEALEAIRAGQMSSVEASRRFHVPESTIRSRANAMKYVIPVTLGKKIYLTEQEELRVRIFVKNLVETGAQCETEDIIHFAVRVLKQREGNHTFAVSALAVDWVENFRKNCAEFSEVQSDKGFTHICDLCGFSTAKKKDLRVHIDYHAEKPSKTRNTMRSDSQLDIEMAARILSKGFLTINDSCRFFNVSQATLLRHMHSKNITVNAVGELDCFYCGIRFVTSTGRRIHETGTHLKPNCACKCRKCGTTFMSRSAMSLHKKTCHKDIKTDGATQLRVKRTRHPYSKEQLQRAIDAVKAGTSQAEACRQFNIRPQTLCNHILGYCKKTHGKSELSPAITGEKKIACEICGNLVASSRISFHVRTHGPAQFKCTFKGCTKKFNQKQALIYHIKHIHEPKLAAKCPKCEKTFPSETRLRFHFNRTHDEPRFFCEVEGCSYKSTRMEYMKLHLRNHRDIDVKHRDELIANVKVNVKTKRDR